MSRWVFFIAASFFLHLAILAIPFRVSFSEDPEPFRLVVDVSILQPRREDPSLPAPPSQKMPVPSKPKISSALPEKRSSMQEPIPDTSPLAGPPAADLAVDQGHVPDQIAAEPRFVTGSDTVMRISPVYPLASRRRGEEGEVRLIVTISPDGGVVEVDILDSSGHGNLDEAAAAAIKRWKFNPGSPEKLIVPVIFQLE